MPTYDSLIPYPIEYVQKISSDILSSLNDGIGDARGMHLGTGVAVLGRLAARFAGGGEEALKMTGVAVAWGKMLGLPGMDDCAEPSGTQVPSPDSGRLADDLEPTLRELLAEEGAHKSTWATMTTIAAVDLICQAKGVIDPSVPKTILIGAVADEIKLIDDAGKP